MKIGIAQKTGGLSAAISAFCAILCTALLVSGCSTARMALPPSFPAETAPMQVSGHRGFGRTLRFGQYEIRNISRGWRTTSSWRIDIYGGATSSRKSSFEVLNTASGEKTQARCVNNAKWQDLKDNVLGGELTWRFAGGVVYLAALERGEKRWELIMEQDNRGWMLEGRLSDSKTSLAVRGTRRLEGSSWEFTEATGYIFSMNGRDVAAVETLNEGRIWVDAALSEELKDIISASSVALLLYGDLRE